MCPHVVSKEERFCGRFPTILVDSGVEFQTVRILLGHRTLSLEVCLLPWTLSLEGETEMLSGGCLGAKRKWEGTDGPPETT